MHPDIERHRLFSRRTTILVGGQALMFAVLTWRLYDLQVVRGKRFKTLAEENRISLRLTIPPRGLIVDRKGREIAANQQEFRAVIVAERIKDIRHTLDVLEDIIEFDRAERLRLLKEIRRRPRFVPVAIRRSLSWEQVAQVEVNSPDLPGVYIEQGLARRYPYGQATAHVIGYVAAVEEKEQKGDPLLQLPDFRIGKNGIERSYDLALRGHAGARQVEINAHGRVIRELSRKQGTPGKKVVLTLDAELQKFTAERMKDVSGAAIVMDVHTGDVLALASTPGFDPEVFGEGIDRKLWRQYLRNPKAPMTNKVIAGQYAPGSTFKLVVALAALEAGVITPYTGFVCPGFKQLGNARFHCWKRGGHGLMNLHQGIKQSCDVYFYNVALKVGIDKIAAMAHKLGLGGLVGVDLPGERKGSIPSTAWKMRMMKQPWYPGETLVAGIGQGYVLATPLQLAVMVARIANGGFAVKPHLARDQIDGRDIGPRTKQSFKPLGISKKSLELVRSGMNGVTNEPGGTAFWTRITEKGMWMAGKTGTSQVRRITKAERARGVKKNRDLPWELRDHALFVAFAPHDAPRFACAIVVEHGGGGSHAAAPIAKDVLTETQKRLNPTIAKKPQKKTTAAAKPKAKPAAKLKPKRAVKPAVKREATADGTGGSTGGGG
jgi:penicillin-binding protein 2